MPSATKIKISPSRSLLQIPLPLQSLCLSSSLSLSEITFTITSPLTLRISLAITITIVIAVPTNISPPQLFRTLSQSPSHRRPHLHRGVHYYDECRRNQYAEPNQYADAHRRGHHHPHRKDHPHLHHPYLHRQKQCLSLQPAVILCRSGSRSLYGVSGSIPIADPIRIRIASFTTIATTGAIPITAHIRVAVLIAIPSAIATTIALPIHSATALLASPSRSNCRRQPQPRFVCISARIVIAGAINFGIPISHRTLSPLRSLSTFQSPASPRTPYPHPYPHRRCYHYAYDHHYRYLKSPSLSPSVRQFLSASPSLYLVLLPSPLPSLPMYHHRAVSNLIAIASAISIAAFITMPAAAAISIPIPIAVPIPILTARSVSPPPEPPLSLPPAVSQADRHHDRRTILLSPSPSPSRSTLPASFLSPRQPQYRPHPYPRYVAVTIRTAITIRTAMTIHTAIIRISTGKTFPTATASSILCRSPSQSQRAMRIPIAIPISGFTTIATAGAMPTPPIWGCSPHRNPYP
ncbi:hypothetical protein FN846DRAFT_998381 [Sphaerosporella brunnea]|uniref:Uncharacterized protein n=1 Tax=Sphaerosporella brunnea TaxID=1250544 RepID=A0A5J5FAW3_9PEZI|nr:hypothetical protein FN846DRAFT_998381 [Sphaerosporella brunnea]